MLKFTDIIVSFFLIVRHCYLISACAYPCEQRFWLEASTLSNRGEMRQHLPTDNELHPPLLAGSQYPTEQGVVSNEP